MLSLPPHSLGRRAKVLAALLALAALPADGTQDPPATAWQALLAERPEVVDDTSVSNLERNILQLLTPEQADAYAGGGDAAEMRLPNGETLASWLDRQRRLEASGLLYKPLVPCRVLDTRRMSRTLAADEELFLHVGGAAADFSHQGGEDGGCGVPGLRGEVLRTNTARALMLSVEIHDAAGPGSVELWPGGGARRPGIGLLSYGPDASPRQMLVVGVCDEESVRPCDHGDIALVLRGAAAHVVADVLGYFEPPWTALAQRPAELEPADQGPATFKTTGLWQQNGTDIYYSGGKVGIGTDTPYWTLSVSETRHPRILLRSDDAGLDNEVGIGFSNLDGTEFFQIGLDNDGDNALHIGPKYLTSKYLTILSDGKVGINTVDPDTALTVYGRTHLRSNNPTLRLTDRSVGEADPGYSWNVRNQNSAFKIYEGTQTNSPALFISSGENVGINTTTPDTALTVYGTTHLRSNNPILRLSDNSVGETDPGHSWNVRNQGSYLKIYEGTQVNSPAFLIRSDGNVGIHTTQPEEALEVDGNLKVTGDIVSDGDICIGNCQ